MKILIHRGANEIGGTCIQLSTENTMILLDLGLPLSKQSKNLDVAALKPDAVLISHPHQDHFGLIDALDQNIPVYIGELGKKLIDATRMLLDKTLHANNFRHFKSWEPFAVGDFTVTPYLVDHSAVDAYGFLIEAEGKRVFYSGDFRAHGRKSVLFENMLKNPPKDIDLLFMEGTMMQRNNDDFPTETDVERKILEVIKKQENITFLISSSQNIDRIVSAYRACKRAGKTLVIDIYTAWVLEQLKMISAHIPAMEWELVMVYASFNQDKRLKDHPEFFGDFRKRVYQHRVKPEELHAHPESYLFFGKMSHFKIINLHKQIILVNVIYSQWLGYLSATDKDYPGAEAMAAYRNDPQVNFVYAHTSGHATVEDLQKFASALKSKMLVPVHTEYGEAFNALFKNVVLKKDNIEFKVKGENCMGQTTEKKFKRVFDELQQEALKKTRLYKDHISTDIATGVIFPAFRNNTVDFYHKGGKAFHFADGVFSTHVKYASVLQGHNKPYIDEKELKNAELIKDFMGKGYSRIKENCSLYSGVESAGVSAIFARSSFALSSPVINRPSIVVLDIEVSLKALESEWEEELEANDKNRTQDRIDLLLYNTGTKTLQFFEAKHYSNNELWSKKTTKPRVVEQVKRYNQQIDKKYDEILSAYKKYIEIARSLFGLTEIQLPNPEKIEKEVILLVFGFDNYQKEKIKDLLILDKSLIEISYRFFGNPKSASEVWNEQTIKKKRVTQ